VKEIDFLPQRYRDQSIQRASRVWRICVMAIVGGVVLSATVFERQLRRMAAKDLAAIEQQFAGVVAQKARIANLQQQLRSARSTANLFAYARHPWPRTQVLASVTTGMPDSLMLATLKMTRETVAAQPTAVEPRRKEKDKADEASKLQPSERDLVRLRESTDASQLVVMITGTTRDTAALHRYLEQRGRLQLFSKAELTSLERQPDAAAGVSNFSARLVVRPGYGQPGGPPVASGASKSVVSKNQMPARQRESG